MVRGRSYLPALLLLAIAPFPIRICNAYHTSPYSNSTHAQNTNLTSPLANQASGHVLQTDVHSQVQQRVSIAPLPPHSLTWNDIINNWSLVFNNWQAFPPSSATAAANAFSEIYVSMHHAVVRHHSELMPKKLLSFTYRDLCCTIQAMYQAVPWGVVEEILKVMMALTRAGLVGLYTVAFYFLKGSVVGSVVVVLLLLMQDTKEGLTQNLIG